MIVAADTADGFVFEYKKLGDVLGELHYSGCAEAAEAAEAAGALGAAWGFPSLILKDNHMGVGVEDTETVLVYHNHAEALVVGGGHIWEFGKKLPWVRHMAVVAMPEPVDHNPEAIVATVFAAVV